MRMFCEFSKVVKVNHISILDKHSMSFKKKKKKIPFIVALKKKKFL